MLNGNSKKVSAVGDETIASIVEYVVGLLGAGCTARGSIELQDGDEIAFPVQYASYKKLLKQAKGNPAIEGYVRAMLNVANASRSTKFSANSQLDRAKLVLTARSALTYDSDLGVGPLGALPDEVTNAFVDELGCD